MTHPTALSIAWTGAKRASRPAHDETAGAEVVIVPAEEWRELGAAIEEEVRLVGWLLRETSRLTGGEQAEAACDLASDRGAR